MININICIICSHEWASRKPNPKRCANCKSPCWNKGKLRKEKKCFKPKYDIRDLNVNDEKLFPWPQNEKGNLNGRESANMNRSICQYGKRHGKHFHRYGTHAGLKVRRVS